MIKTEYRRDLQHTWMILSGGNTPDEDAYPVRMLTENRIDALLSCTASRLDEELRFYYDITALYSLKTVLEAEPAGKSLLEQIFASLAVMMERLEEYLLDPDGLLLDPSYLFFNTEQTGICFCWYPGRDISFQEQAGILGRALLPHLDQSDKAGVVVGYGFYQQCMTGAVTPEILRKLLRKETGTEREYRPVTREELERSVILDSFFDETEEEEDSFFSRIGSRIRDWFGKKQDRKDDRPELPAVQPRKAKDTEGSRGIRKLRGPAEPPEIRKPRSTAASRKNQAQPEDLYGWKQDADTGEGQTVFLGEAVLSYDAKGPSRLVIREQPGDERTVLLKDEKYLIGKKGSGAGLQLQSAAVSRLHARLEKQEKGWILCDLNSRNGTFRGTDPNPLLPEQEVLLTDGDVIRFADVSCIFYER